MCSMKRTKKIKNRKKSFTTIQQKKQAQRRMRLGLLLLVIVMVLAAGIRILHPEWLSGKYSEIDNAQVDASKPDITVKLLTPNPYSRPGIKTGKIKGIVVHYTANPGTSARQNRDYFNGLAETKKTKASSHFVIGLEGEIVQCIPCNEISYASNNRNSDTISIECCIEDETGKFNDSTYQSLIELTTWLMGRYDLSADDVIRHYDVTGKKCPLYFVEHEDAWEQFHKDLDTYIEENGVPKEEASQN